MSCCRNMLLLPAGLETQKEEVVGIGEPPRKSCNCGGGCPIRSCVHRGTNFPKGGRTIEELPLETPLNTKSREEKKPWLLPAS